MLLSFLSKLPHKFSKPSRIITSVTRFSTAQNPRNDFADVPSSHHYDDLVNVAVHDRDWNTVCYLLNKRVRDHCFNSTNTFKFITNTESSLSILDDLCKALARLDNGFPRKSAFDMLISRLCKLYRIDESLGLVNSMAEGGYGLSQCSFHPILNALTKRKKMEDAWNVMEIMKPMGVPPDLTAYNYLLTAYCYDGNVTAAGDVMEKIEEEKLGADSRTYDALVLGACRAGTVEGALVLLRRMEDDGMPVLYATHTHVITQLLSMGFYAQALKFVKICRGRDRMLDTECFGFLASRLIRLRMFNEAGIVLEEMNQMGLSMSRQLKEYYEVNVVSNNA